METEDGKCKDCCFWDKNNYLCKHPENSDPNATAPPDGSCIGFEQGALLIKSLAKK